MKRIMLFILIIPMCIYADTPSARTLQAIKGKLAAKITAAKNLEQAKADATYQSNLSKMKNFREQLQALVGTNDEVTARDAIIKSSDYQQTLKALNDYYATSIQPKDVALQQALMGR